MNSVFHTITSDIPTVHIFRLVPFDNVLIILSSKTLDWSHCSDGLVPCISLLQCEGALGNGVGYCKRAAFEGRAEVERGRGYHAFSFLASSD